MQLESRIVGGLLGHGVGDALGVPVEFSTRTQLSVNPVTDYIGFKCWNQPPGTFSDDSSMMYCTAESLCKGYNLNDIASKFVKWYKTGYWGARDELFDIGNTTRISLQRVYLGEDPKFSGEFFEESNGNGSLMRILPLAYFLLKENSIQRRYQKVKEVSSITHAHFRSVFSCFIFTEMVRQIIITEDRNQALIAMRKSVNQFIALQPFNKNEIELFKLLLDTDIQFLEETGMNSGGYVLDSLESSFWCFLTTHTYQDAVFKSCKLRE